MTVTDVSFPIGRRIHVVGNSCSGKTTFGARLAAALGVPFVEIDALNWLPDWVALNTVAPEELDRRLRAATAGDGWVVAGSYMNIAVPAFWDRLETVVWLDPPLGVLLGRVLARSWRRWRTKELLWGTNRETFWSQLALWRREESLIWWIVSRHARKRRGMNRRRADPRWRHVRFVRLRSSAEADRLLRPRASG